MIANHNPQVITTPGWPQNYPNNADCTWLIATPDADEEVFLRFTHFSLEDNRCRYDFAKVSVDGIESDVLCGTGTDKVYNGKSRIGLFFKTDSSDTFSGFRALYWRSK